MSSSGIYTTWLKWRRRIFDIAASCRLCKKVRGGKYTPKIASMELLPPWLCHTGCQSDWAACQESSHNYNYRRLSFHFIYSQLLRKTQVTCSTGTVGTNQMGYIIVIAWSPWIYGSVNQPCPRVPPSYSDGLLP